ncbi:MULTISPECIES: DUF6232 family protein [unclassified Streptomyces]|uniref:DUF6232 family protein n=1 Tax=unclassified Streptomyces TaxID=2593676 RepID=UPI001F47C8A7|nr:MULTISPECIES: DUF6232 family protein [unclassified Streptomyces]WKE70321.1 DUF6232 family protein [Streptomyces sp. WP-1]
MQYGHEPPHPQPDVPPAPTAPPPGPAPAAPPMPDIPAPAPHPMPRMLDLRVSKRILWIGRAVYPLANIARVYSFVLRPRRKEAVLRFLRYSAGTIAIAMLVMLPSLPALALGGSDGQSGAAGYVVLVWLLALGAEIFFLVDMLGVLTASPQHVLAVETSGASTALVTSPDPRYLDQLVDQLSYAIEHPDTEFRVTVQSLTVSPRNYYFGDNVNMYGGSGNTGISS